MQINRANSVTTTGLSKTGSVADRGFGFLFLRAWLRWFGGLGIVGLSIARAGPELGMPLKLVLCCDTLLGRPALENDLAELSSRCRPIEG